MPTSTPKLDYVAHECILDLREFKKTAEIEIGNVDKQNNALKNAPHTIVDLVDPNWDRPYSREQAVFPVAGL